MVHFIHALAALLFIAAVFGIVAFDGGNRNHKDHNRPPWPLDG
jgi:hypothetical protein